VVPGGEGTPAPPPAGEPGTATARFDGDVIVTSGAWRASSTSATAWLGRDRKLDRVELTGTVSLQDSQEGRSGKAEKATDWPRDGKTVLEGHPAVVVDREGNRVAGATLTISNRGGSVEITAPEGGRTETIHKTGTEKHRSEKTRPE
jgi:lipopolysaccharide export system protein LptA